jgi:hypothetical protein
LLNGRPARHTGSVPEAVAIAEALVRRIASLPDFAMRVAVVRELLQSGVPEPTIDAVAIVCRVGEGRAPSWHEALDALIGAIQDLEPARRELLAQLARERGHDAALRLLTLRPSSLPGREVEERVPDYGVGRPLTRGERKSLARRPRRELIERALGDPDPEVIRTLLGNPRVTENDVVRLCARRPCPQAVLRAVADQHRWTERGRVRLALVRNPDTPLDVALRLVPLLLRQELRDAAQAADLGPALRAACADLLRTRPPSEEPDPTVH